MHLSLLSVIALQYVNIPYQWNGKDPLIGLDCSGFVERCLRDIGEYNSIWHRNAQQLHDYYFSNALSSEVCQDCLLFFGESIEEITHVAIALDDKWMINASGGNSSTIDFEDAVDRDARVKIQPIKSRRDLMASFKLVY